MKKRILGLLFFVITFMNCYSQKYISFSYNGKIGYLNQKLEVVLSPQYDYGSNFRDGYAVVKKGSEFYIIDPQGNIQYSTNAVDLSHIGKSYFVEEYKLNRIIDIDSKKIIADNLSSVEYAGGERNTSIFSIVYYDSGKGAYINNRGENLFKKNPDIEGYAFNEGVAVVMTSDWRYTILDIKGNIVDQKFSRLGMFFSEGLCPAQALDGQTGYVDTKGQFVFKIPLVVSNEMGYENTAFENGRAIIKSKEHEGYWSIIDNRGNYIKELIKADLCWGFSDGMSLVHRYHNGYSYVNTKGDLVFDFIFSKAESFQNGYARVVLDNHEAIVDTDGNIHYSSDLMKNHH